MARTIDNIKDELKDAFMQNETLQGKYGWQTGDTFDGTFSRVSIESILLYIVAVSIWTMEKLMDKHTKEVEDTIASMKPHSLRWYAEKAKAFMYGESLIEGTDQYDTSAMSAEDVESAKIVKFAACTEDNATLYMKVAKRENGTPAQLSAEEQSALEAYLREVKDAGVRVDVINKDGDHLILNMTVYYDPLLMTATGESKNSQTAGHKLVEEAIKEYIENLPFNGEFRKNALEDAIQSVEGVVMVEFGDFSHSETGIGAYEMINAYCKPVSGYFKFDYTDITQITYLPYEH